MDLEIEVYLRSIIFPDLERGRPNWDKPHTQAVVKYVKEIMRSNPHLQLDDEVMIIAATAHDWGYSGLFEAGRPVTFAENLDKKEEHMRLGAEKAKNLLFESRFNFLSKAQKDRIVHLIAVHDKVAILKDTDELVLMEADTMGVADPTAAKPTHTRAEYEKWRKHTEEERVTRFITDYSKEKVKDLLDLREKYYLDHNL